MKWMKWCVFSLATTACVPENKLIPDLPDVDGTNRHGCIVVEPEVLTFDDQEVAQNLTETQWLTLSNRCADLKTSGPLAIRDVYTNEKPGFEVRQLHNLILEPGESTVLEVTFNATKTDMHQASVKIVSDDPKREEVGVPLRGLGLGPDIHVEPDTNDFGEHPVGCEVEKRVLVSNRGNQDLVIDAIDFDTASEGQFEWASSGTAFPLIIPPFDASKNGPMVPVVLAYKPLDTIIDHSTLAIHSNDPAEPISLTDFQGQGLPVNEMMDEFKQPKQTLTDVLFTFDRSCSMNSEIASAQSNFTQFISDVVAHDGDYRIAAVTADDGCISGGDTWIDNTMDEATAQDTFANMIDLDRTFSSSISNTERGFQLIENALSPANLVGCNADLLRDKAHLNIIHISDETEQSISTAAEYLNNLELVKNRPEAVTVHAVAPDYPSGCPGNWYAPGGYYDAAFATDGLFLSICTSDWGTYLNELAESAVITQKSHRLSLLPIPETITVDVDGVALNHGWRYDKYTNTVVFDEEMVPASESLIRVMYDLPATCDT